MDGKSLDIKQDKLEKLKELFPEVFTEYPPYNTGNDHLVYPDRFSRWRQKKKKGKRAKVATARDFWVLAVNNHGGFGKWAFLEILDPWMEYKEHNKGLGDMG